jgi:nitroimidazol reductase NimA-like FMN-containing flavoprotein (pyridoxamine 5'-phosphate oxidase superfamily)
MSKKEDPAHASAADDRARVFPMFLELTADESRALLARHNVGRIAFSMNDRIDIQPIHYVFDGDWLYGRTSHGSKFATLARHSWCAFEVDEARDLFDWDSVVVKGHMELLDPELGSPDAYTRGLELMRSLVSGTFTEGDPAPHRSILFRLRASELTGRAARPGP